MNKLVYSTNFS